MRGALFFALFLLPGFSMAQTDSVTAPAIPAATNAEIKPAPPPKLSRTALTAAELQKTVDQLTQSNRDLLDLLKKQQAVLEDMQFDRRQQSRRLELLEERLTEAQLQNAQLQNKVANLEEEISTHPAGREESSITAPAGDGTTASSSNNAPDQAAPAPVAAPPPATYLPPPESEGAPGTQSWHRLFTLKGEDSQQSDLFHIEGRTWRVLWHNQDPEGKNLKGTSGLFIDAFPKDDTIPQHACAKVGTGGDATELDGPGNYYLKITASGGSWELAVEDFR